MLKEKNVIALKDNQYTWSKPDYYKRLDESTFVSPDCDTITESELEEKLKETFIHKESDDKDLKTETCVKYTLVDSTEFEFNSVVMDHIINQEKTLAEARTVLEKTRRMFGVA